MLLRCIVWSPVKAICTCLVVYGWDKLYKFAQVLIGIGWLLLASIKSLASLRCLKSVEQYFIYL
ncbi:hypothetical protein HanXRQr2_Chr11g0484861 [Helianthus annuus]|uniref:Uncharacterized protein n=1 Tax=Helianthus annuus TaxID=4232 RepID=A0A9K3HN58_HELAN|nr:hypothetical protein HanXRQr2_Chr11g0484861 [Helianthus annuus]KAJ0874644.1 hypothetical protein HanPSC8_Chr11g0466661 [Helianthus annuus]